MLRATERTPAEQARYARALDEIINRADRLDDQTIRRMIELLQELRRGINTTLTDASDFERLRVRSVQANINHLIDEFSARLQSATVRNFRQSFKLGQAALVEPFTAIGLEGVFFANVPSQINAVVDFTADLIQDITEDMRGKINSQIRLAALGQKSAFDTMRDITNVLGVKARDGVWGTRRRPEVVKGVAARAEAILRTEQTRVYNLGHRSQQVASAEQLPGLRKQWMATPGNRTRDTHLRAHGQTVPIDEPFRVGRDRLQYPGDPRGSAGETINCRCRMRTLPADFDAPPNQLDQQIQAERDKRK